MLRTLNDEGHAPGCQGGHCVPLESFRLKHNPESRVDNQHEECQRVGGVNAEASKEIPHRRRPSALLLHWAQSSLAPASMPGLTRGSYQYPSAKSSGVQVTDVTSPASPRSS